MALLAVVLASRWAPVEDCHRTSRGTFLKDGKVRQLGPLGHPAPPATDPPILLRKDPLPAKFTPINGTTTTHPLANLSVSSPETTPSQVDDWVKFELERAGTSLRMADLVRNEGARIVPSWEIGRGAREANEEEANLSDREVEVYDCSKPKDLEAVTPRYADDCLSKHNAIEEKNASYVVLQPAAFQRITVRSCKKTVSQLVFYCGAYDHQTFMPQHSYFHRSVLIPKDECEGYWLREQEGEQLVVMSKTSQDRQLLTLIKNGVLRYTNQVVGKTWTQPGGYDAKCRGGLFTDSMGKEYDNVVASDYVELELLERTATVDRKGVLALELEERVLKANPTTGECMASSGHCETLEMGTFIWKPASDTGEECPLYRLKEHIAHGREVVTVDRKGKRSRVFMSTDNSHLRLLLGKERNRCGSKVIATDYDKIFLSDDLTNPLFSREIHSNEVSMGTYATQQDGYIYYALGEQLSDAVNAALKLACEREVALQKLRFAELAAAERARMDGETASLGEGRYATAAGEVWYTYACRPIVAQAMNLDKCYSALPVRLAGDDEARYMAQRGELPPAGLDKLAMLDFARKNNMSYWHSLRASYNSTNKIQFFMEPGARRLTTMGIIRPCSESFEAKYRNRNGHWIVAKPAITVTTPPREVVYPTLSLDSAFELAELDLSSGGLYDFSKILDYERLLTNGRRGHDIVTRMTHKAFDYRREWDSQPTAVRAFTVLDGLPSALGMGWVTEMWEWLTYWSNIVSVAMSVYLAFRLVAYVGSWCLRLVAARAGGEIPLPELGLGVDQAAVDREAEAAAAAVIRRELEEELKRARAANEEAERSLRRRENEADARDARRRAQEIATMQAEAARLPFANQDSVLRPWATAARQVDWSTI